MAETDKLLENEPTSLELLTVSLAKQWNVELSDKVLRREEKLPIHFSRDVESESDRYGHIMLDYGITYLEDTSTFESLRAYKGELYLSVIFQKDIQVTVVEEDIVKVAEAFNKTSSLTHYVMTRSNNTTEITFGDDGETDNRETAVEFIRNYLTG